MNTPAKEETKKEKTGRGFFSTDLFATLAVSAVYLASLAAIAAAFIFRHSPA